MISVSVVSCGMLLAPLSAAPDTYPASAPRFLRAFSSEDLAGSASKSPLIPGLQKASKSAYHVRERSGWVGR